MMAYLRNSILLLFVVGSFLMVASEETTEFTPHVTATCKGGIMNIKVMFTNPYSGAVHARDYRNSNCMTLGNGTNLVGLSINLLGKDKNENCGAHVSKRTEERSIQLAVRVHKTLELADDKFYEITCGKTGFSREDGNSQVLLKFIDSKERRVRETVYGREYTITAEVAHPDSSLGLKVKNCFAFNKQNLSIPLIDNRGCPIDRNIITKFTTNSDNTLATATLKSMFKFPEGSEVHMQCDIAHCNGACNEPECSDDVLIAGFSKTERLPEKNENSSSLAATTVFVIDPAQASLIEPFCDEGGVRPTWLLWLAIALGVLFLVMLLMNIFLCTAMSCSCARTEIIEKEPSIIEEYDPYRSWHGSQYGSRYSLHGRDGHNKGYVSGSSTIHSNRSVPFDTDNYAIVHSRPGTRHLANPINHRLQESSNRL